MKPNFERILLENIKLEGNAIPKLGYSFPPFLAFKNIVKAGDLDKKDLEIIEKTSLNTTLFQVPMRLHIPSKPFSTAFKLPIDPLVSISGGNNIIRRTVAKQKTKGTIKEFFATDDYKIEIQGILIDKNKQVLAGYSSSLREIFECGEAIDIACEFLNKVFEITSVVIEDFDMPFTPGTANQAFSFSCYSDEKTDLII